MLLEISCLRPCERAGTSALVRDENVPTTLAFVQLDETGNRSFTFYRKPGADIMLRKEEVPSAFIYGCGVFHFGSVSLTDEPCRTATLYAASAARKAGALVSYDPNYRPFLWPDIGRAKKELLEAAALADVVKVSEDELFLLTGENDLGNGCRALQQHGPVAVVVTLGPKGAYCSAPACEAFLPTYDVPVVDTTGAGDAFWGALLWKLHAEYGCAARKDIAALTQAQWRVAMKFANAAGSLTTTKKGAIPAMPSKEEIDSCVRQKCDIFVNYVSGAVTKGHSPKILCSAFMHSPQRRCTGTVRRLRLRRCHNMR